MKYSINNNYRLLKKQFQLIFFNFTISFPCYVIEWKTMNLVKTFKEDDVTRTRGLKH